MVVVMLSEQESEKGLTRSLLWRIRIFACMWFGYVLYYFSRKSFTIAIPVLMSDLNLDKAQVGMIASSLTLCYGVSKFTSGILSDKLSPRVLMALGLLLTGSINICFGLTTSFYFLIFWWGMNGWCQGLGALPCAKLLVQWYPQKERGRWWSCWNTAHNVGAITIALLVGYLLTQGSWRLAMWVPGTICIFGGFLILFGLRDSPESVGLPPVEGETADLKTSTSDQQLTVSEILFGYLLKNRVLLLLSLAYFLVYAVRIGICDWTIVYLNEHKGYTIQKAVQLFILFEIGGCFGNLTAGWMSDTLFAARRGPVNALFTAGAGLAVYSMWVAPTDAIIPTATSIFFSGFFIFGPQMLVGVQAAEAVDRRIAASGHGFVNLFGYLGASAAGYPLGRICQDFGWNGFFLVIALCAAGALALLLPLWSLQAHSERVNESKKVKIA